MEAFVPRERRYLAEAVASGFSAAAGPGVTKRTSMTKLRAKNEMTIVAIRLPKNVNHTVPTLMDTASAPFLGFSKPLMGMIFVSGSRNNNEDALGLRLESPPTTVSRVHT